MNKESYILVETLVTVVILGIGLVFVLNALSSEIHALRISKNYTHASLLLESKLAELEKRGGIDIINEWKERSRRGSFSDEYSDFLWEVTVGPIPGSELVSLRVKVIWREVGIERELGISTFMPKI